jgi:hypothetical protein
MRLLPAWFTREQQGSTQPAAVSGRLSRVLAPARAEAA